MSLLETILPPVTLEGPDGSPKPSRMQRQEQLAAAALSLANAIACVALLLVLPGRLADGSKRNTLELMLGGGIVLSFGGLLAARFGNRIITSMVLLAAGFIGPGQALSPFFVVPHYGMAFWMMMRQNKLVKTQTTQRREARLGGRGQRGSTPAASGRGRRQPPKLPDGRPAPPPSKRYTPPRPKKRPIPVPDDKAKAKAERDASKT